MKKLILTAIAALMFCTFSGTRATTIAIFDNPAYVDSASASALQSILASQGNTVSTFTGFTSADLNTVAGASNLLLFPDLLNFGALVGTLDAAAKSALAQYVTGGGALITAGGAGNRLLNAIFYPTCDFVTVFCFASSGSGSANFLDNAVAAGTPYAIGPAVLDANQTDGLNPFAFTPAGGLNIYRDEVSGFPNSTTVLTAPFGSGDYGYLAWGFAGATPGNAGNWDDVLGIMVPDLATPAVIPLPGTLWLAAPLVLMLVLRKGGRREPQFSSRS